MLSFGQKKNLVLKLEKCKSVTDNETRDAIVDLLPPEWNLKRSDSPITDITNIVNGISDYKDRIDTLIEVVDLFERNSLPMQELKRFVEDLFRIRKEKDRARKIQDPVVIDPETKFAQELHWDRDIIVETFVGMVKGKQQYDPWRILALEGPREAGLSTLVQRLEFICEQLAKQNDMAYPLLYARIKFEPRAESDTRSIVKQIVTTLAANADMCLAEMEKSQSAALPQVKSVYSQIQQELDKVGDKVDATWGGDRARSMPLSESNLAKELTTSLKQSGRLCPIVLLFENFEHLDFSSREWVLDSWLKRNIVNLENLVIILVGESGLSHLEGRDKFTYCHKNIPTMSQAHLLEWAQEGWGLTNVSEQDVASANEECKGNPAVFFTYLKAWAIAYKKPVPDSCRYTHLI